MQYHDANGANARNRPLSATQRYFEMHAESWEQRLPADFADRLMRFGGHVAARWQQAQNVLEIGTGTGAFVPVMHHFAPHIELLSVDLAFGMVTKARRHGHPATFMQADAHDLPLHAHSFDTIICHNSFPHFQDKMTVLREMRRILSPGGQLMILHNMPRAAVNEVHRRAGPPIDADVLPTGDVLKQDLLHAGFVAIHVEDTDQHFIVCGNCAATSEVDA